MLASQEMDYEPIWKDKKVKDIESDRLSLDFLSLEQTNFNNPLDDGFRNEAFVKVTIQIKNRGRNFLSRPLFLILFELNGVQSNHVVRELHVLLTLPCA